MSKKARDIAVAISSAVGEISIANGYNTDIGLSVFRGKMTFSPDEMPCSVVVEGEDVVLEQRFRDVRLKQRYLLESHRRLLEAEIGNPNDIAHLMIVDLKRSIFKDPTLGGIIDKNKIEYAGRNIGVREDGQPFISASIEIDVEFSEDLSNP